MKKLLIILLLIASPAWAADIYVSTSGSGSTCSAGSPCALSYANSNADDNDIVYLLAGPYDNDGYINPTNSGSSGNPITYQGVGTVTITGQTYGVYLSGDSYITIQGITFDSNGMFGYIDNSSTYNIIDNCTFSNSTNTSFSTGLRIFHGSNYNWIKNCTMFKAGVCSGGEDAGSILDLGWDETGYEVDYNLVENNTLYHGGHHVVNVGGRYNVIRNNYIYHDAWMSGNTIGNRTLGLGGQGAASKENLIENNKFGYADTPCDAPTSGAPNLQISTSSNIVRYNSIYHSNIAGLQLYTYSDSDVRYNKVYNNTFFNNANASYQPSSPDGEAIGAIYFYGNGSSSIADNYFKNNLYYSHNYLYDDEFDTELALQHFANEWGDDSDSTDPLFTNASTTRPADKTDSTVPDLNLQYGSPAINQGGALTTVSSGCSGSTSQIVLNDASYFQDGTWGLASEVDADWIAVGSVTNTVQISSISSNTVNLASSISCSNSDKVWLYKDSDGTRVLYGFAPDVGAYEYSSTTQSITGVQIGKF